MTTTSKNQKWFFPAQEKITNYLWSKFKDSFRCEFQDVCKHTVYENYTAWKGGPGNQEHFSIQFIIYKPTKGSCNPAIIKVYYEKHEDTMQYEVKLKAR